MSLWIAAPQQQRQVAGGTAVREAEGVALDEAKAVGGLIQRGYIADCNT
jgi:hypothetical protein